MTLPTAAERHPHLAAARPPGTVRVDMHLHTMWSGDATTTPDEIEAAVVDAGIDVVCITDHGTINGALALSDRLAAAGCRVVVGQEVRTHAGELIGLFLSERLAAGLRADEAAEQIRAQGGLVYVPHPFDPIRHCLKEPALQSLLDAGLVDALEGFNAKTSLSSLNAKAAAAAAGAGVAAGAGSDAHEPSAVGAAYVEMADFDGAESFLASLRSGALVGHHYDAARQWSARVVPSTKAL